MTLETSFSIALAVSVNVSAVRICALAVLIGTQYTDDRNYGTRI